jgi:glycosyltransferase involved in cell wall biosynthesis
VFWRSLFEKVVQSMASSRCIFIAVSWSDSPVSIHFRCLADELAARGHTVVLLIDQQRHDVEQPNNNPCILTWPSKRPTKLADARFVSKLMQRYRPDCVIGNFSAVNVLSLVGWWRKVPLRIMWYHTLSTQLAHDSRASLWKTWLQNWRKSWFYSFATHIVANSTASCKDVQIVYKVPERKCHVTYFSLPDPHLSEAPEIAQVLCVGRLDHSKGQDVLLRAMSQVMIAVPHAELVLIGDGPQRTQLEQLAHSLGIEKNCHFLGRLAHAEVLKAMSRATVTIVPSRAEAFGLVNVESFAVGTPVIASRVGGIPDIYSSSAAEGFLVPPDNPDELAEKITMILKDPTLRAQQSSQARQRYLDCFQAQKVIPEQADWLESLIATGSKSD